MSSREHGGISLAPINGLHCFNAELSQLQMGDASDQDGEMLLPRPHIATLEG